MIRRKSCATVPWAPVQIGTCSFDENTASPAMPFDLYVKLRDHHPDRRQFECLISIKAAIAIRD
jgi:hypothetical protein